MRLEPFLASHSRAEPPDSPRLAAPSFTRGKGGTTLPVLQVSRDNQTSARLTSHRMFAPRKGVTVAEALVVVCDVCGRPAEESVTIRARGRNVVKDFCTTHLTELLSKTRAPRRGRK